MIKIKRIFVEKISSEFHLSQYKALLRVRRVEEILALEYRKGVMRTPTHFGVGQEAVAVGVCSALEIGDVVYSPHRSHTHYIAKGGNLLGLIAELLGREAGCSRGRGGSVHLVDRSVGYLGSSPILGHSLALAAGSALAFQMDKNNLVAVAFFGEGALDEGAAWETFNFAAIHKLPVLFICENNLYATESPLSVRHPLNTNICNKVMAFGIKSERIDGNSLDLVREHATAAVKECRNGNGPFFIECMTYRWLEHVGPLWDYEVNRNYRDKEELDRWIEQCPVKRAGEDLLVKGVATQEDLARYLAEVDSEIFATLEAAYNCSWPLENSLFDNANEVMESV